MIVILGLVILVAAVIAGLAARGSPSCGGSSGRGSRRTRANFWAPDDRSPQVPENAA